jgi:hypothetical protein
MTPEPYSPFRGIIIGLIISTPLWAVIWELLKWSVS